jgi:hypothetical protein
MPKGPNGPKRPTDVIGAAVLLGKIATGEIKHTNTPKTGKTRSGFATVAALPCTLTPKHRTETAKKAASERWH